MSARTRHSEFGQARRPPGRSSPTPPLTRGRLVPLVDDLDLLGEGPCWFRGSLWWVDIDRRLVHRWSDGSRVQTWQVQRPASAVLPASDGSIVVTTSHGVERLHPAGDASAELELLVPIERELADTRANDAAVDPVGTLFVGTMHVAAAPDRGTLYRIRGLRPETVWHPVTISNGLGWSPGGEFMYYVDTARGSLDVIARDADGRLGPRRCLVPAGSDPGVPDGLAVAVDGTVWVARWGGSRVVVYGPDGKRRDHLDLPVRNVTSCAFGAAGRGELFVTSAADPDDPEGEGGAVYRLPVGIDGVPVTPWRVAVDMVPESQS